MRLPDLAISNYADRCVLEDWLLEKGLSLISVLRIGYSYGNGYSYDYSYSNGDSYGYSYGNGNGYGYGYGR